ncbi:MAG: FAD-dependent monooxygenase, partial [Pseudomonadota bacterium]
NTPAVAQTSFIYDGVATALQIKPEGGVDHLIAPRRTVLDRVLVDAASTAGAKVRHGVTLQELVIGRSGQVTGCLLRDENGNVEVVHADLVIGADGRQSSVARLVDAKVYRQGSNATGCVYGYFEGLTDKGFEWFFADGVAAGAIPTNDGQHCVFTGVPGRDFAKIFRADPAAGFMRIAAANSPDLAQALTQARRVDRFRAFGGVPGYMRQSAGPGWALVGDAGYFKDPLTAHGITDAFRDAHLLARTIVRDGPANLGQYQTMRDELSKDLFEITEEVASFEWDMEAIGALHHRLSRVMKHECAWLDNDLRPGAIAA